MSTDERTDAPTRADQPVEATRPRLRLHHLFALTAVMAVLLAIGGPRRDFTNPRFQPPQIVLTLQIGLNLLNQILAAVAITALGYGVTGYRRGLPFFNQPGHWILVEISLITLLGIPVILAYRSVEIVPQMGLGDFPMLVIMLAGVYSIVILFLGRILINVYLALTKCAESRWRNVFVAKGVAAILFGLGDIGVIAFLFYAMRRDRREQLPRDASHRCGVFVQFALSGLTIVGGILWILTMILMNMWHR